MYTFDELIVHEEWVIPVEKEGCGSKSLKICKAFVYVGMAKAHEQLFILLHDDF